MQKPLSTPWLMGFIDGDGYFGLERVCSKRNDGTYYVFYRPVLAIAQTDPSVLYKIKAYVGCGQVTSKGRQKRHHHYRLRTHRQFLTVLVPMFDDFEFQTCKRAQWALLKSALTILDSKEHDSNRNDLESIDQALRACRETSVAPSSISRAWFVGFFEAEGCLYAYKQSGLGFKVTQKNPPLLEAIRDYFGYGRIQCERAHKYCFVVTAWRDLGHLATWLEQNPMHGQKNVTRNRWLKAYRLLADAKRVGWTESRRKKFQRLTSGLNK